MTPPILLAVPNVSEGRDERAIRAIARAFGGHQPDGVEDSLEPGTARRPDGGVRLFDVHSDRDHHRSVFTLAGAPGALADALLSGARATLETVDVMGHADAGIADARQHPHVGALDVVPIVYLDDAARGAACAQALVVGDRIADELKVPVFLYGELTEDESFAARTRAELRRGGVAALAARIASNVDSATPRARVGAVVPQRSLKPDFGHPRMHPTAGCTLVAARPPLVAFNLQLAPPATLADAHRIAAIVREGGAEGLPGVRAIGIALEGDVAQVSMNVEQPFVVPLAVVVEAVGRHARIASAELVGLAPRVALAGLPAELPMPGFDPERHTIENALGC